MVEIWKETQYKGYEVSNLGRLRKDGQIRTVNPNNNGYVQVYVNGKTLSLHRIVAMTFLPNPENKCDVNHLDSNRSNNNLSNLEWATRKENIQHCLKKGRLRCEKNLNFGEKHYSAKLTEKEVLEIRKSNLPKKVLAKKYGVLRTNINRILLRQTWKRIRLVALLMTVNKYLA